YKASLLQSSEEVRTLRASGFHIPHFASALSASALSASDLSASALSASALSASALSASALSASLRLCPLRLCPLRLCPLRLCTLRLCPLRLCPLRLCRRLLHLKSARELCSSSPLSPFLTPFPPPLCPYPSPTGAVQNEPTALERGALESFADVSAGVSKGVLPMVAASREAVLGIMQSGES
ncbi:unnamed protein product, partial [Closterium sp. NIES-53]